MPTNFVVPPIPALEARGDIGRRQLLHGSTDHLLTDAGQGLPRPWRMCYAKGMVIWSSDGGPTQNDEKTCLNMMNDEDL